MLLSRGKEYSELVVFLVVFSVVFKSCDYIIFLAINSDLTGKADIF